MLLWGSDKTMVGRLGKRTAYPLYQRCGNVFKHAANKQTNQAMSLIALFPEVPDREGQSDEWNRLRRIDVIQHCLGILASCCGEVSEDGDIIPAGDGNHYRVVPRLGLFSRDRQEATVVCRLKSTACDRCFALKNTWSKYFSPKDLFADLRTAEKMEKFRREVEEAVRKGINKGERQSTILMRAGLSTEHPVSVGTLQVGGKLMSAHALLERDLVELAGQRHFSRPRPGPVTRARCRMVRQPSAPQLCSSNDHPGIRKQRRDCARHVRRSDSRSE